MYKKTIISVVIAVFIFQMVVFTQLFALASYAAIQDIAISTPTPSENIGKLKVEFYNSSRNGKSNAIFQNFRVTNIGDTAVNLSPTLIPNLTPTKIPTLTPTITSSPTPKRTLRPSQTPGAGNGLRGEYYNNIDFTDIRQIKIDSNVNFEWGYDSPNSDLDANGFSVRWIGEVEPLYSEQYTFYTKTDDGVKLWVDDILLIDNRTEDTITEASGTIDLDAGVRYSIRIEYYDKTDNATAILLWSSESQEKEVIPQTQLYPPKIFNALDHRVRTANNNFAVGDFVPLMLELQIMWPIENPVISIDLNLRKPDSTASGFILREIKSRDNTNMFKINVNDINETNFTVSSVGVEPNRKLNILISRSFSKYDKIQVYYFMKTSYFNAEVKNYPYNVNVSYKIAKWRDLGVDINDGYSFGSTNYMYEKTKFKADIKLEDPILLE
jgi:hypothetical protein